MSNTYAQDFEKALQVGRPPNITRLFPNSKALIVSGKVIDRAMLAKGKAMTIAANGRNHFVIRGALKAAQRANAAIILEIAKSEGGRSAYCATNYWNLARQADQIINELGITVPVAIHADHYAVKNLQDLEDAKVEVPSMFEAGITSIAVDASHQPDPDNLLATLALAPYIPSWSCLETEVGEIKGSEGLSTAKEALFLIQGLNAHGVFPDWIALNNGTAHGIQTADQGIQVELTTEIHQALEPYKVSGAQHGTSGNTSERLMRIASETNTTKANVATALQMISWGVKVDAFGNAALDGQGNLIKLPGQGVSEEMWAQMQAYAAEKGWNSGNTKKLNLPFENKLLSQPASVRHRMVEGVEQFVYELITKVFNAEDTAPLGVEAILKAGGFDLGPKAERLEDPAKWSEAYIRDTGSQVGGDKGPKGDFDD
ncbi:MAG: class II fructose-bisphosphate aldolase [Desulfarculaceae bacterium]|nr:class II fructose-bisphosphate aldolase [Desulfarculaceae bacterium]MCF8047370.1 class II fructose-bisphosphate aldolase [Desulfarculaceae bacterium]MCF8063796.1 class II fructose-bisphosphate aldolase [Desulfarculaceae bacterium]MCF8097873.1 class II fructose-bisphosphate aldolase [Desulfarculaceae bacterium]MCF8122425.1 class II fructose-bisphosphate aldolase [Desulfarculaceae bacterium]